MFTVTTMRALQLAALQLTFGAALLAAAGASHAQWMWIDAKGLKQVSDRPPPASISAKNIIKSPAKVALEDPVIAADAKIEPVTPSVTSAAPTPGAAAAAPGGPLKGMSWTDREAEFRKRKADQAIAEKKAAGEAARNELKAAACKEAQGNKMKLDTGVRIRTGAGRGEFMDDKARAENSATAANFIANNCN